MVPDAGNALWRQGQAPGFIRGYLTLPVTDARHTPHPENPAYGSFRRGHNRRVSKRASDH